jgi:hypothetical protein
VACTFSKYTPGHLWKIASSWYSQSPVAWTEARSSGFHPIWRRDSEFHRADTAGIDHSARNWHGEGCSCQGCGHERCRTDMCKALHLGAHWRPVPADCCWHSCLWYALADDRLLQSRPANGPEFQGQPFMFSRWARDNGSQSSLETRACASHSVKMVASMQA